MWDVADRASAEFMKQFYFALARGESGASALRRAKLQFLRSGLAWSHPRYWAPYVLNGDGTERLPRVIPWSVVAALLLSAVVLATGVLRSLARRYYPGPIEDVASVGNNGVTVQVPSSQSRPITSIGNDEVTRTDAPGGGATSSKSSDSSSVSRVPFGSDRAED